MQSNLFCTDAEFAPVPTVGTVPSWRAGWMVPGGGAGRAIPPLHSYSWDDKGF